MRVGRLHVITDVVVQTRHSHEALAAMACLGGADVIQLRDKSLDRDSFAEVARRVAAICREHRVTFIVNDRVDVAREVEADGVHVGQGDTPVRETRVLLGPRAIIGTSTGSVEAASGAEAEGADYVGVGHIFATSSKLKSTPPLGLDALARVVTCVRIPVIAIGGITEANAREAIAAGAFGVAVIGAVCADDDPRAATERLKKILG